MSHYPLSILGLALMLPGCFGKRSASGRNFQDPVFNLEESQGHDSVSDFSGDVSGEGRSRPLQGASSSLRAYEDHPLVRQWINYFAHDHHESFAVYLRRGSRYRLTIEAILRQHAIPEFLYYLAMIESGFSVSARSNAQAVGVWQFIEGTGKRYDLMINNYVDERRDPIRATIAAAKYLKDLHNVFQSWFLAMAAYNCGEYRVLNAIMTYDERDFWSLSDQKALPPETRNYLPKILAAAIIDKDPEKYGFDYHEPKHSPHLKLTRVPTPIRVKTLAETFKLSDEKIRFYNPQLLGNSTPPQGEHYQIWLPAQVVHAIDESSLASLSRETTDEDESTNPVPEQYRVRKGDNLQKIAAKFSIPIATLKANNHLRNKAIYPNQLLKLSSKTAETVDGKRYRVKRGDSLASLAKRFGLSIPALKKFNGIKNNSLVVGQELKVPLPES